MSNPHKAKPKCRKILSASFVGSPERRCRKNANVRGYCHEHDPILARERRMAKHKADEAKFAEEDRLRLRRAIADELLDGVQQAMCAERGCDRSYYLKVSVDRAIDRLRSGK